MADQIEIRKEVVKALETLQSILSKLDGIEEQPKKKAVRKPKVVIEEQEQAPVEEVEQPKKKAGRKPKAEVITEVPEEQEQAPVEEVEQPKKKAGRKPKAEVVEEEVKPKAKRIPRVTPVLKKQLDVILKHNSVVPNNDYYKEYVDSINAMSDEEFEKSNADVHMDDFAKTKIVNNPTPEEHNSASGGTTNLVVTENLASIVQSQNLKETSIGIFQDENGNRFTGPLEDEDEDMETVIVKGIEYVVGTKTQRVYKVETDGPDVFVGFSGVGDYKDVVLN
jgi:hypothetical protein